MEITRRRVLGVAGAGVAGAGALGWMHRRQLRRRDDRSAISAALDVEVPAVDAGAVVTDDHLASAHEDAREVVDDVAAELEEAPLEGTNLEALSPDALADATRGERGEALSQLAWETARHRGTLAGRRYATDGADWDALEGRLEDERTAIEETVGAIEYTASSRAEAIVQYAPADLALHDAWSTLRTGQDALGGGQDEYALGYWTLSSAADQRRDAEWYAAAVDGGSHLPALEDALGRTLESMADSEAALEESHDEADASYVATVRRQRGLTGDLLAGIEDRRGEPGPYLAHGIQAAAYRLVYADTLSALGDAPAASAWEDVAPPGDADALPDAKRRAVDGMTTALNGSNDPLTKWLIGELTPVLVGTDAHLETTHDNVNVWSSEEWHQRIAFALLSYREVAAVAGGVPETVDVVLA